MENTVSCFGLTKMYNSFTALDNVSLELPSEKIIGLLGPNGSGKTTFLKLLAGVLQPTAGSVNICGMSPSLETKKIVSYLPERQYFDTGLKVDYYLSLFDDFYEDFDIRCAEGMIHDLGVDPHAKIRTLSKGMIEKVQLALVMSRRAKLYLLDEPLGGVDPASREYILKNILSGYTPHATLIISTHMIRDVEDILDGYIFLGGGHVIGSGDAREAKEKNGTTLDEMFREVFRCY
ncbi:MAG: ABC transporter ATP-binding protein [Ruminococcaceae bacterium]|nr:ABC transporter ATP-binding protein [Oscillospiraceae bacterium]